MLKKLIISPWMSKVVIFCLFFVFCFFLIFFFVGGESYVLKAIDFSKTDIETLSIEHDTERLDSIREIMKLNSLYNETKKDISDIYYAKLH